MGESKPWELTAFMHVRTRERGELGRQGERMSRRRDEARGDALLRCTRRPHFHTWDGYREKLLRTRHTEPVAAEFRALATPGVFRATNRQRPGSRLRNRKAHDTMEGGVLTTV